MSDNQHHQQNIRASLASISTAFFLAILKTITGVFSGSIALIASALDSLLDALVSIINFFTIRASAKPPDADHRFGHGKFEAFAELAQALFIGFSGLYLAAESMRRFFVPQEISHEITALVVMVISITCTFLLILFLKKTAKTTGSLVVKADTAHYTSDLLANAAVIIGLLLVKFTGLTAFDAIISFGIALLILYSSWELIRESFEVLTDKAIPKKDKQKIIDVLNTPFPRVNGWHMLRTRRVGSQYHIDFHIVFDEGISLIDAHHILDDVEREIWKKLPNSVLLVHMDPYDDSKENERKIREL